MNKLTELQLEAIKSLSNSELSKLHTDICNATVERSKGAAAGLKKINDNTATLRAFEKLPSIFGKIQDIEGLNAIALAARKEFYRRETEKNN